MMEFMKQWIINIVALVLFIVLIEILLPSGKMKKYVSLATGTILIIAIICPIIEFFGKNSDMDTIQIINGNTLDKKQIQYDSQMLEEEQMNQIIEVYRNKIIQQMVQSVEEIDGVKAAEADIIFNEDYNSQTFGEIKRAYIYVGLAEEKDGGKKNSKIDTESTVSISKVQKVVIGKDITVRGSEDDIDPKIKKCISEKISGTFGVNAENIIISQLEE